MHIPFCKHKCPFCDFAVTSNRKPLSVQTYFDHLSNEINAQASQWQHHGLIDTLFVGGGTPSYVDPAYIAHALHALSSHFAFAPDIEMTIECNPDDVTLPKTQALQNLGFNRFSLGAQSFDNQALKRIGRCHQAKDIEHAVGIFSQLGIENWSMDLMFMLPNQTLQDWQATLKRALAFDPPHISTYELTIEPQTLFGKLQKQNKLPTPPDGACLEMFQLAKQQLTQAQYACYETSNAAKALFESKHNLGCWEGVAYWGVGLGAHSRWIHNKHVTRYQNPKKFSDYLKTTSFEVPPVKQNIAYKSYIEECVWTGLRLNRGIPNLRWKNFTQVLGNPFHKHTLALLAEGMLIQNDICMRISNDHIHLADSIALDLLS